MPKVAGVVFDYNGTFVPGYHEIPLGYAVLGKAREERRWGRVLELAVPLHAKCLYLTFAHKMDELGKYFSENVLDGEDAEFVERFSRGFDIHSSGSKWARRGLRLPKLGKKMGTKPIEGAVKYLKKAKERGKKTGIYSHAFQQPIEHNLDRYNLRELFDGIMANPWTVRDGKIDGMDERVPLEDKSKGFREFLGSIGLREDGDGVVYVFDSLTDVSVAEMVEFPAVVPGKRELSELLMKVNRRLWARCTGFPDWEGQEEYTLDND